MTGVAEPRGLPTLRVGIVGAGYVSKYHIAALRSLPYVQIVGVADSNLAAAQQVAESERIALACRQLEDLTQAAPNCIYILTPPSTHCDLALKALQMNCHVLVEKPMAENSADCLRMIDAARNRGLTLSVNHSDLFDPAVERALALSRAGACGDVLHVDIVRSSEYRPYAGGPPPGLVTKGSYPFQDLGVHALYQIEAFLGEVQRLDVDYYGTGRNPNPRFDEWRLTAVSKRGVGRAAISWNSRPMQNQLVVRGTKGRIEVDKFLQTCVLYRELPGPKFIGLVVNGVSGGIASAARVCWSVLRFMVGNLSGSPGIVRGAAAFARSLHDGTAPPVSGTAGAAVVGLIEAASARADAERAAELTARMAPLPPADCLVTGANGFVGRALVQRLLQSGATVRVLVRRADEALMARPGLQLVVGDLGDPAAVDHAVRGVRCVFHVGAAMRGRPEDFHCGTVWGARNIVDACLRHGSERLVYVSSMSVLDHAGNDPRVPITEQARLEPRPEKRGLYTQTKLEAEGMVAHAVATQQLPAVIIRPGQIFGAAVGNVPPNGVIAIGRRWIVVGGGRLPLPLVYIDDVIDALVAAGIRLEAVGKTIHVVDTTVVSQREYLASVALRASNPPVIMYWPVLLVRAMAAVIELLGKVLRRDVPLTGYRLRSIRPLSNFDCGAAGELLGWRPRVGAKEGLRQCAAEADRQKSPELAR